jgi:hypothetical protein
MQEVRADFLHTAQRQSLVRCIHEELRACRLTSKEVRAVSILHTDFLPVERADSAVSSGSEEIS